MPIQSIKSHIKIQDAITWQVDNILRNATDPMEVAEGQQQVMALLANIKDDLTRQNYFDQVVISRKWKGGQKKQLETVLNNLVDKKDVATIKKETVNAAGEAELEIDDPEKFPKWAKPYFKQWQDDGFMSVDTVENGKKKVGFYTVSVRRNDDGQLHYHSVQHTNFIAEPIMHVSAGPESLFIVRLINHLIRPIVEVPAAAIPTPDLFIKYCIGEGNFFMFCNTLQWKRIASGLMDKFVKCISIPFLGWQNDGFFAFVNGAYIPPKSGGPFPPPGGPGGPGWQPVNENGIIAHNKEHFLIPASSQVYLKAIGRDTDVYQMDRPLLYQPGEIDFTNWAAQMYKVYGDKGLLAISSIAMSLFRDVLFNVDNNCPLLYAFGEPSSGKSKWAESINAVFFRKRMAFNVNSGTDHAFFSYMQKFVNTIAWLNEVDEATLKPEWFQALKGAYDGESRERGRIIGGKLKTEIQKILGLILLSGQKLITADDNSLVTRSLIEGFSKEMYTEEQRQDYIKLKEWEDKGLTNILVEVLQHRQLWEDSYKDSINALLSEWRYTRAEVKMCNQRILQNWAHSAVCYTMLSALFTLPVSADQYAEYCLQKAVKWSKTISESDVLSEFWATLQNLVNTKMIREGWDYIVQTDVQVRIDDEVTNLQDATQIIYLRLGNIHPAYEADSRKRGKNAMSKENLLHYFSSRKYFLGAVRSKKFHKFDSVAHTNNVGRAEQNFAKLETVASCHAFRYNDINVDLTLNEAGGAELAF